MSSPVSVPRRRILLITTGSTPQVVTETVHALATASPRWIPQRMILATTSDTATEFLEGRRGSMSAVRREPLLGPDGKLFELSQSLGLALAREDVEIVVPRDRDGSAFRDIRTAEEVLAFAEEIFRVVAGVTAQEDTELHVSLAGGRKTMSFLAGQVMSLLGRPQDRLSHVLVEPASLESPDSGFWWPGDGSPGGQSGRVILHDVAFLRTRAWFGAEALSAMISGGYAQAVAQANAALAASTLVVDLASNCLEVAEQRIRMAPVELAVVALVAIAAKRGVEVATVSHEAFPVDDQPVVGQALALGEDRRAASELWAWLRHAAALDKIYDGDEIVHFGRFDNAVAQEVDSIERKGEASWRILPRISKAQARLKSQLPPAVAQRVLAKRHKWLGMDFDPAAVTIRAPSALATHPQWPAEVEASSDAA